MADIFPRHGPCVDEVSSYSMGMDVITLTGNLLAEWTFEIGHMERGTTHRAQSMSFQVGGKGINVTRMLTRLGRESEAIGFASGTLTPYCDAWLDERGIQHRFFPLDDAVRPGVVIRESPGEDVPETTFLGKDAPVPQASWTASCAYILESGCRKLAICGSIPGWESDWTRDLEPILAAGCHMVVDTYGPPLKDLVRLPVDLVKINLKELRSLFDDAASGDLVPLLKRAIAAFPVRNWIITDGPGSMAAAFEDGSRYAIAPAVVEEVSAMGSGDTFLAAFLNRWSPGKDPVNALGFACACATGNAASKGFGDFPLPPSREHFPEIIPN